MKKTVLRVTNLIICAAMLCGIFGLPVHALSEYEGPVATVPLVPGSETVAKGYYTNDKETFIRKVTANTSEVEVTRGKTEASEFRGKVPVMKYDPTVSGDMEAQNKIRELHTENFTDTSNITVNNAPDGFPFRNVGDGDYSGHYVSKIFAYFLRDEDDNPILDENGNFILDKITTRKGVPLTLGGEKTLDTNGPFDQLTGTRPVQMIIKNGAGNTLATYCVDIETATTTGVYYSIANIDDVDYYANETSVDHIKAITQNGYWGTAANEDGSIEDMRQTLKDAVKSKVIDSEYEITFVIKGAKYTSSTVLKEGEYVYSGYVYSTKTEKVTLTDEVIDGLTEGEAVDAMQMSIWSYANGANKTLNGTDRFIVGDITYSSSALADTVKGENDFEGAARTKALYTYLTESEQYVDTTSVLTENNFIGDIKLTVAEDLGDGVYNSSLGFVPLFDFSDAVDDLTVVLTYTDPNGITQTITESLTGPSAISESDDGFYVIDGLTLTEGEEFDFTLNVYGSQHLSYGTYILLAEGGKSAYQTLVTVGEGTHKTDVHANFSAYFNVEERSVPETVEVCGKKYWDDNNDKAGLRPESITVYLLADGERVDKKTVTAKDGWAWEFRYLPKYDGDNKITYTVEEAAVSHYYPTVDGYDITNTFEPPVINISGRKVWNDRNDIDGLRPDHVVVQLKKNGITVDRAVVSAETGWAWSFNGLEKFQNGREIFYSVYELPVYGYTAEVTGNEYSGYVITNTHTPETVTVSGSKTWIDNNDAEGLRPESITVNLYANGEYVTSKTVTEADGWAWTFAGLPKYANGANVTYTVDEEPVPYYTASVSGYSVTNTCTPPERIRVFGVKTWDDNNDEAGKRPAYVTVSLYINGEKADSKTVTEADGWVWNFGDLLKYDEDGNEIIYEIKEAPVQGYTSEVEGFNVKNTYVPPKPPHDPLEDIPEDDIPGIFKEKYDDFFDDDVPLDNPETCDGGKLLPLKASERKAIIK